MKFDIKKRVLLFLFLLTAVSSFSIPPVKTGDSLKDSALQANRRTALRCLQLASSCLADKNYEGALSQASMGIAYYEGISDLWYIVASAKNTLDASKAELIPLLEKAFELNCWVNYNRDNARVMYADILSDTGRSDEALAVLDEKPSVFSSDAEYIRVKSCYRIGDDKHISTARNKIDGARRIYPDDTRFPLLFFKNESPSEDNADVVRMKKYFINMLTQYVEVSPDKDAELEIYAAWFADGKEREHLLKSFKARGLSHPLYAIVALDSSFINQKDAFNYIADFADSSIDYELLELFMPMIKDKETLLLAKEYFDSYNGSIVKDTDGDGIANLYVKYSRGRPQEIFYDRKQNGLLDWSLICDFGSPVNGRLSSEKLDLTWDTFPYLKTLYFNQGPYAGLTFTFASESVKWSPVSIKEDLLISSVTDLQFFFPEVTEEIEVLDGKLFLNSISGIDIAGKERENSKIHFTLLDGQILTADYYENDVKYAQAWFKDNLPDVRVCDKDGDGVYEVSEFYSVDTEGKMNVHSLEDIRSVTLSLFGLPSDGKEFYLKTVQIDTNGDTAADFIEEYSDGYKKISSWDNDSDGKWDVRHVRLSEKEEQSIFYDVLTDKMITVNFVEGKPLSVSDGERDFEIKKDSLYDFFWIEKDEFYSDDFYSSAAKFILKELSSVTSLCYSKVYEYKDLRIMAVKSSGTFVGKIISEIEYEKNQEEDESSENAENENKENISSVTFGE